MWYYKEQEINSLEQLPENLYGFIYLIENKETGRIYIGKKNVFSTLTKPLGKRELAELVDKRRSKKKKVTKESNWLDYWGSNKTLLEEIKEHGYESYKKTILHCCFSKKELTYYEIHYQCMYGVLLPTVLSYNDSILGKFFKADLV
jgi:hypothetical protein